MIQTHRRRLADERGQSLVEFALVVPLLLLVVVGIIEFGRAWNMSQVVTDAARQGARTSAVLNSDDTGATEDSVVNVVKRALANGNVNPDANGVHIEVDNFQGGTNTPTSVLVEVPYQFAVFGPVMALANQSFDDASITLRSRSIMRNE